MPIDRAATLRNAEKLIRQGKIDAAIASTYLDRNYPATPAADGNRSGVADA